MVVVGADKILKVQAEKNENNSDVRNNQEQYFNNGIITESGNQELENEEISSEYVIEMSSDKFQEEVLNSNKTVLIDFYATWCGPCKILAPTIEEIAKENKDIKVVKIDVDKEPDLAMQYKAFSIPTLVVIESGEIKNGVVGVVSKEYILNMIHGE